MQVRSEGWHRPLLDDGRINFTYVLIMEVAEGFCVTEMVSPCSPVGLHGELPRSGLDRDCRLSVFKTRVYSSRLSRVVDPGRKSNCSIILGGKVVKHSDSYRLGSLPSDITEDVSLFIKTNLTVQY